MRKNAKAAHAIALSDLSNLPDCEPTADAASISGAGKIAFIVGSVWVESFPFTPHSICPVLAENRGVFEAIFHVVSLSLIHI